MRQRVKLALGVLKKTGEIWKCARRMERGSRYLSKGLFTAGETLNMHVSPNAFAYDWASTSMRVPNISLAPGLASKVPILRGVSMAELPFWDWSGDVMGS